ncbi:GTP cyclohydrolase I FolE [Sulfolobus acidocaldarius]|uniref:GTP cyclohydrolase 1 n=4 Tax=Sulfolobus acidocaldarius TaxID=2285 RepID=GCH1_SULAC|nr:GTP cyclohydrolase I FolE [Sulfolobus acidocaldarius]Q4J8S2.1 RecName: Full=GTP cyclohydrolase 1; AltName: Full=GTP cyclohydrolase I; Short=GTP-CH-I [Sulfolobus acidocaldarius DSM 639]AHC51719.1 GTP cyclohydrolase [Sulfolobus acidocaldarius SUSAZ]AAY80802.1 GTP cyclohydrolase I [Sulfolobus acidocaldarius DSM 639]AGE71401.1 GTP cyclohydrolase I [Sulfolobus acidocaldarius N8]AGE73672.1 GTP cyclohydrolase I [Sulfolobus acidocaldarius Ron12/I]ALU30356.1 GTP cyclohydrolase [Sulfolobus acidocald
MEQESLNQERLVEEIAKRVKEILQLIGEDTEREGLKETPERVAKALLEMTSALRSPQPYIKVFSLAENENSSVEDQIVLVKDISFSSLCEHHLLPIIGKVHVAYVVGKSGKVAGLSKIIRLVNYYASRPQIQERLVEQIAEAIMKSDIQPKGVMVIGDALHMCTYVRGVKDREASLISLSTRGIFSTKPSLKSQVFRLINTSKKSSTFL